MVPAMLVFAIISAAEVTAQNGVSPRSICQSTCSGDLGENIFPDGDFGSGVPNVLATNPGIAPGYNYTQFPPPQDGSYTITNNTSNWGSFAATSWIDIEDRGPEANGYMMVVNASYQPGLFYQKQVPVCENTLYEFSIDVISMNTPVFLVTYIQPNVAFEINGNTVCSTNGVPVNAAWQTYRFSFLTDPGATQVTLGLRNDAPGGFGNDLAIDNISFRACGPDINVPVSTFFCAGQPVVLNASLANSPYSPTFYQWQTFNPGSNTWDLLAAGNNLDYQVPQPMDGNQYRLVVASSSTNLGLPYCRAVSQALELILDDVSDFKIGGTDTIVCNGAPGILEAGAFAAYNWSTGATTAKVEAPTPGWYAVTVTTSHECMAQDSLYVYEVELSAQTSTLDPHCFGYEDGRIEAFNVQGGTGTVRFSLNDGPKLIQTLFDSLGAGAYTLIAVDSLGCRFPMTVQLNDPPPVQVSISGDRELLVGDSLLLNVTTNLPLTSYTWQPSYGLSCDQCPAPVAMPLQTTVYTLRVTDAGGCPGADSSRISILPRLDVYAPNVFLQDVTNNDINNGFTLYTSQSATLIRRLDIFDRWGELVFRGSDALPGSNTLVWNGLDFRSRVLDEGVYTWVAEIEFSDGGLRLFSGDVTLLRRE